MPNSSSKKDGGTTVSKAGRNQGGRGGHAGAAGKSDTEFSTENVKKAKTTSNNDGV